MRPHNVTLTKVLDRLTSRRMSIALMVFVVGVSVIGAAIPQRVNTSDVRFEAWRAARPAISAVAVAFGFDAVFSSWWFLAGLALFTLSLAVATWRMFVSIWRRKRIQPAVPTMDAGDSSLDEIAARARARGYRRRGSGDGPQRLVRHSIGLWGPPVMHAGLLIAVVAGLLSSALTARGILDLSQGEVRKPGSGYLVVDKGRFASDPEIGRTLRLDGVSTESWPGGELRTMTVRLSLQDANGTWVPYTTTANSPLRAFGHVVYVSPGEFGDASFLVLTGPGMPEARSRMEFTFTPRETVSYARVTPEGWPTIEGRWDPSGVRGSKPLTLRLSSTEGTRTVSLAKGEHAALGPYNIEYALAGQWARLTVVRPFGVEALFLGFAVIALGSLMLYLWVPRELVLTDEPSGVRYAWRAARMARSYESERDEILGWHRKDTA